MSDQRTLRWKSGRLPASSLLGFWQLPQALDVADPQIPNLPLENPAGGAYTLTAQHGTFALSGQTVSILRNRSLLPTHGAFALSGQDAALARNRTLLPSHGTFAFTGQDADIDYTPVSVGYELIADHGAFALTGQSAEISVQRAATPIAYWDVTAVPQSKKQKKQDLATMLLLLG